MPQGCPRMCNLLLVCLLSDLLLGQLLRGVWEQADDVQDAEMQRLSVSLPFVIQSALAPSTTTKYERGWALWMDWASHKPEVRTCPSDPFHIALYFNHLLQTNGTKGALIAAAYGINWAHHVGGFASPLDDPFVKLVLQGCEKLCGKPITKKDPLTCPMIKELIDLYRTSTGVPDLRQYRFLLLTVVCFSGFLRIDEILQTQLQHVQINSAYLSIFLPRCKNDQHRKGNTVYIARTNSAYCPVHLTEQFLHHAKLSLSDSAAFLIPRLVKIKQGHKSS